MGFIQNIREEIEIIRERDPAIHTNWEVFLYPSFKVMLSYRRAHRHYLKGHYFRARWISQRAAHKTGIEIHPGAKIGKGLFIDHETGIDIHPGAEIGEYFAIDHGTGVVIGATAIIGNHVKLYQGVTLGGNGKETGKRHPTLGNNVMVSAGAKILGSFTVGDNSKVGAGSVVLEEVPPNSTVVGVPGRIVKRRDDKLPQEELKQDLNDPIHEEIDSLELENMHLLKKVEELELEVLSLSKDIKELKGE